MKDERGLYYHAYAGNPAVRIYVRAGADGEVEFRMWDQEHSEVWEQHPWLPMRVISEAAGLYKNERKSGLDPLKLYDINIARSLLREGQD